MAKDEEARRIDHWYCQAAYPEVLLTDNPADTMALEGCGPCSLAHALIAQGVRVTPPQVVDALNRTFPDGSWTGHFQGTLNGHLGPTARQAFDCQFHALWPLPEGGREEGGASPDADALLSQVTCALRQGRCVIVSSHGEDVFRDEAGRPYTSLGHYVCFYAVDPDGTLVAADSSDQTDERGRTLATGAALYSPQAARDLLAVALSHPERHEVVEVWRA